MIATPTGEGGGDFCPSEKGEQNPQEREMLKYNSTGELCDNYCCIVGTQY